MATTKLPTLAEIEADGFAIVGSQGGGSEGWKEEDGQVVFVDHWGGVWAKAEVGLRQWKGRGWVVWDGKNWVESK